MKRKWIVCIIAVVVSVCAIAIFINQSYYPMGGEVTIVSKEASSDRYYITVEQGEPGNDGWGQFELECSSEQYQSVNVGDVVGCDREQSAITHKGSVHQIYNEVA